LGQVDEIGIAEPSWAASSSRGSGRWEIAHRPRPPE